MGAVWSFEELNPNRWCCEKRSPRDFQHHYNNDDGQAISGGMKADVPVMRVAAAAAAAAAGKRRGRDEEGEAMMEWLGRVVEGQGKGEGEVIVVP